MKELERIDRILNKIRKLWKLFPNQRFFQLGINFYFPEIKNDDILFYLEDDKLEKHIDTMLAFFDTNKK